MKIEKLGKDAQDRDCPEGYYATDGRTIYLVPPLAELVREGRFALRVATQAEVDAAAGKIEAAWCEHIVGCDPRPSGDGA